VSGKRQRMVDVGVRLPVEIVEIIDRRVAKWNQSHLYKDRSKYLREFITREMLRSHNRRKKGKKAKR
jgi:Arc/MetJ-type ribon-helix-helix transcriptional regulator